jgi:nitroimidazol reductase NimA-like FMN-containing flavoprotein (pyridoxamine 5'-phosphate oxidase superfamily)
MDMEVLSREESLALLASVPVGRIVFTVRALPAVQLMNFVVDNGGIVIRTGPGTKLAATLRNGVVAFETDEIDSARSTGWSVTVIGRIQEITDPFELERLDAALTPWAPGEREHFLKITPEVVTGRRLTPAVIAVAAGREDTPGVSRPPLGERDTPLENGPALRAWPYDQGSI